MERGGGGGFGSCLKEEGIYSIAKKSRGMPCNVIRI